ncbi:hypothetical protein ACHAQA_003038 [Verticillium albo-atrum]
MASLLTLPIELLEITIQLLCYHCNVPMEEDVNLLDRCSQESDDDGPPGIHRKSTATLAALALTCRHLNAVCTPVLYHFPTTQHIYGHPSQYDDYRLLNTLVLRPDLARHVRRFRSTMLGNQDTRTKADSLLTPEALKFYDEKRHHSCLGPLERDWWADPKRARPTIGDVASLCLALCVNVEALFATMNSSQILPPFLNPGSLPRLKRISLIHGDGPSLDYGDPTRGATLARFLNVIGPAAPNTVVLTSSACHRGWPTSHLLPYLKDLVIHSSLLDSNAIDSLVSACPHLERFVYISRRCSVGGSDGFTPRDGVISLFQKVPRLRSLQLDLTDMEVGDPFRFNNRLIEELTCFEALEVLSLSTHCFMPRRKKGLGISAPSVKKEMFVTMLPKSLRILDIRADADGGDEGWVTNMPLLMPAFRYLAGVMGHHFPLLKRVSITGLPVDPDTEVAELFDSQGVEYRDEMPLLSKDPEYTGPAEEYPPAWREDDRRLWSIEPLPVGDAAGLAFFGIPH